MSSVTPASTMGLSPFARQNRRVAAVIDTDDLKRLTQVAEGKDRCGAGVARTGPHRSASSRALPCHHADPDQSGGLSGEKGSIESSSVQRR